MYDYFEICNEMNDFVKQKPTGSPSQASEWADINARFEERGKHVVQLIQALNECVGRIRGSRSKEQEDTINRILPTLERARWSPCLTESPMSI